MNRLNYWARAIRHQYKRELETWCHLRSLSYNPKSQVAYYDKQQKGKTVWEVLVTRYSKDGHNPLQVVRDGFERAMINCHAEYPRPNQLAAHKPPEVLDTQYTHLVTAAIRSDLAAMSRLDQEVDIMVASDDQNDRREAVLYLMDQNLRDLVLRHCLFGAEKVSADVAARYLLSPQTYNKECSQIVTPDLKKLPVWEASDNIV